MQLHNKHYTWYFRNMLFNPLENSTKKKLLPNCKVRKQSQSLNKLSKAKTKTKYQIAFIFFTLICDVSYHHSHILDLGPIRWDACKSILLQLNKPFFLDINLNSESLSETSLLLREQTKIGKNVSIFTQKFNSSFIILMICVIFQKFHFSTFLWYVYMYF